MANQFFSNFAICRNLQIVKMILNFLSSVSFPKQINAIMPRSGNVEKYYSEKEGKMPTKESHNGDKHATNVLLNSSFSL